MNCTPSRCQEFAGREDFLSMTGSHPHNTVRRSVNRCLREGRRIGHFTRHFTVIFRQRAVSKSFMQLCLIRDLTEGMQCID